MSRIHLMRHGHALPGDFKTPDVSRWLSARGRNDALASGIALARYSASDLPVDCIVCSPYSRTVQTAELVARQLGWNREIVCLEALRVEASPQRGVEELESLGQASILAVTHEPIVSSMASILAGGNQSNFRTSEIRVFEEGKLLWRHVD